MSSPGSELQRMRSLSEDDFIDQYVLPMLRSRYRGVYDTRGRDEHGRDALFWSIDEMGDRRDKAAQVKDGNIGGSTREVQELIAQARAAFSVPMIDESNIERRICELYIITSGRISQNAKTQILNGLGDPYRSVIHFWNGERVLQEVKEIDRESEIIEYSQWERLMERTGLSDLLNDAQFRDSLNGKLLPVLVNDYGMSSLQIVDGLRTMLEGLAEVTNRLQTLPFPRQRRAVLLWFSWLIVTKAYYNLGDGKKFVYK